MIRDIHPGSGSWFLPIPDPGVKKAPDPGYGTLNLWICLCDISCCAWTPAGQKDWCKTNMIGEIKNLQYAARGLTRKESSGTRFAQCHFRTQKSLDFRGLPPSNGPQNGFARSKIIISRAIWTTGTSPCNPHLGELGEGGVLVLLLEGLQLLPGQVGPVHGQQGLHPEGEGLQQKLPPSYTRQKIHNSKYRYNKGKTSNVANSVIFGINHQAQYFALR